MTEDIVGYATSDPTIGQLSGTIADVQADALNVLVHPDPDPDQLPALPVDTALALQAETAGHLCRAILRQEVSVDALKVAMKNDMAAWAAMIARAEQKSDNWRQIILAWMQRTGTTQLKSPWFTASVAKGRKKLIWEDEDKVIGMLDALGATAAVRTVRSVVKKELQVVFDSVPGRFDGIVTEEIGEPGLVIRRRDL